jgi:hypothetical protein
LRGEALTIDVVWLSLGRTEGEEGSLTRIRLKELGDFPGDFPVDLPGDFLGLTLFFFFIDNGSTDVVDDRVGVRVMSVALVSSGGISMSSSVSTPVSSSDETSASKCGGLNAAIVSSIAASTSKDGMDINFGGARAWRGPAGFLWGRLGSGLEGLFPFLVGVVDGGRYSWSWSWSSSRSSGSSGSFGRRSGVTREPGGSSEVLC